MQLDPEEIMALVEDELARNPDTSTQNLYERAKAQHPAVASITLRQFNARFPLQIKRRKTLAQPRRRSRATAVRRKIQATYGHEGVRGVFLRFAEDLTSAQEKKDLVRVLATVDRYVEDSIEASEIGAYGPRRKQASEDGGQADLMELEG